MPGDNKHTKVFLLMNTAHFYCFNFVGKWQIQQHQNDNKNTKLSNEFILAKQPRYWEKTA